MAETPDSAPLPSSPVASERFYLALDRSLDAVTILAQAGRRVWWKKVPLRCSL
jgi:hypothetical protein